MQPVKSGCNISVQGAKDVYTREDVYVRSGGIKLSRGLFRHIYTDSKSARYVNYI